MKKEIVCFLISFGFLVVVPFNKYFDRAMAEEPSKVKSTEDAQIEKIWYESWNKGMAAAKKEKKPVLVDFFSDNCPACKAMHKNTFSAPEIIKRLSKDWISIKINTSHGYKSGTYDGKTMNYYKLARYFRVRGVPTFIFFDKELKLTQSIVGYKDKEIFGPILDYMKDEAYKKGITFKEYKNQTKN